MLDWTLIDNNISLPKNVPATKIPPMIITGGYWWDSTSAVSWISCLNTGLHPTTGIGPNHSIKFRCHLVTILLLLQLLSERLL
jgi:hypothetical protein